MLDGNENVNERGHVMFFACSVRFYIFR